MRPNRAQDFVKLSLRSFVPDVSRYDVVPDAPAFPSDAPPVDGALDAVVLDVDAGREHQNACRQSLFRIRFASLKEWLPLTGVRIAHDPRLAELQVHEFHQAVLVLIL